MHYMSEGRSGEADVVHLTCILPACPGCAEWLQLPNLLYTCYIFLGGRAI